VYSVMHSKQKLPSYIIHHHYYLSIFIISQSIVRLSSHCSLFNCRCMLLFKTCHCHT